MNINSTPDVVSRAYDKTRRSLDIVRKRLNRPLTLAEKVLFGHLDDPAQQELAPGKAILQLRVDRVAMQDATAQMAILQFAQAQIPHTAVPTTVHCDHLIQAYVGARKDTETARSVNKEVYDFLASASKKYGIGFWKPGAGIIHQVVLENYAFPGGLMIGTDSHTPNAGGLGMIAVGVGGADAVDAMAGLPWEVKHPKMIGVKLTGKLNGWASPKDVILWVCQQLTVKGGTDHIVEYFGPGCASISATGKGTICNMGAEHGATTSIFPYDERMGAYLKATRRAELAALAAKNADLLRADEGAPYDKVLELDLSSLEPYVTGPHTPDRARPISKLKEEVAREGFPDKLSSALIGSCTNSSYEDIARVVDVARQAKAAGLKSAVPFLVTPGSDQIYETIKRDEFVGALEAVGAVVMANACGPCIGQWKRDDVKPGEKNSILNSFNRNFPGRNDGNAETLSFIASPEIVMALGLAGRLSFNPLADALPGGARLSPPAPADEVPKKGFVVPMEGYVPPAEDGSKVEIIVDSQSPRLQLLQPFLPWDGRDFNESPLLLKAKGKCTTDHISPAGKWLAFRGHLDKISDNMFTGAIDAWSGQAVGDAAPKKARELKAAGKRWVVVGDVNYGEGSSREHAAMSPRYLGAAAILVRSFARIHETNLKKQGVLPLTFANPDDYEKVRKDDRLSIVGLKDLAPGRDVDVVLLHGDGSSEKLKAKHSLTAEQIEWFKAGSSLNLLKARSKA
ncbi:MAG: aconitate hydratase [Planctomycetes bacterium]|nr:aconitate hydratase [Planctomycetota bacterium]